MRRRDLLALLAAMVPFGGTAAARVPADPADGATATAYPAENCAFLNGVRDELAARSGGGILFDPRETVHCPLCGQDLVVGLTEASVVS